MRSTLSAAILVAVSACNGLPPGHSDSDIAGTYHATTLEVDAPNGTTHVDYLLVGGSLEMTLTADGQVSGLLNLPASSLAPAVRADLTGTFRITDPQVDFSMNDTSFVSNLHWLIVLDRLQTTGAFTPAPGTTITAVLSRAP